MNYIVIYLCASNITPSQSCLNITCPLFHDFQLIASVTYGMDGIHWGSSFATTVIHIEQITIQKTVMHERGIRC